MKYRPLAFAAFVVPFWVLACKSAPAPEALKSQAVQNASTLAAAPFAPPAVKAVGDKLNIGGIAVRPKGVTQVRLAWSVPPGTAVNMEAPAHVRWHSSDGLASAPKDLDVTGDALKDGVALAIELTGGPSASLSGVIKLVVCDDVNHAVCTPVTRDVQLGFVPNGTATVVSVPVALPSAK